MSRLRGITVDNGGSEIRVQPVCGCASSDIMKMANDVVYISEDDFRVKEVAEPERLCRVVNAPDSKMRGIFASGITGAAYVNQSLDISSQESKTGNDNFYKQFVYAVACDALRAYLEERSGFRIMNPRITGDYSNDTFSYVIVACIPIKEFNGNKDCAKILKDRLHGEYEVEFPLVPGEPHIYFSISRNRTGVVPEGGVAIMGLRKEIHEDDISLIVDMGHITTDIALFKGGNLFGKVISAPSAGSTLIGNIRGALADDGFYLTDSQVADIMATGTAKRGASRVDVSAVLDRQCKLFVENYLQKEIIQILNMNAINARQVQNFIPIGAPMNPRNGTSVICDTIVKSCGLEYAEVKILAGDLRYVNVQQASNFTKKLFAAQK